MENFWWTIQLAQLEPMFNHNRDVIYETYIKVNSKYKKCECKIQRKKSGFVAFQQEGDILKIEVSGRENNKLLNGTCQ